MRICTVDDCDRPYRARGFCGMHYRRNRLYGSPTGGSEFKGAPPVRLCEIDGCGRLHFIQGLCSPHHKRMRKHGSPTGGRGSASLGIASSIKPCIKADCENDSKSQGLCWSHLNKQRYEANPEAWQRWAAEYRARRRQAEVVEQFTPAEIFERDRWICGLCGKRIPKSRRHPHPQSASVDHVVPLARGGDHSRANAQAAHLLCNLQKGIGGSQQLSLIG